MIDAACVGLEWICGAVVVTAYGFMFLVIAEVFWTAFRMMWAKRKD